MEKRSVEKKERLVKVEQWLSRVDVEVDERYTNIEYIREYGNIWPA